jgi:hypothetical protein
MRATFTYVIREAAMNLSALAAKIREPQYAGLTDQLLADAVNGLRVSVRRPVPTWLVRQTAIEGGYWPSLVEARESTTPAIRALAITVLAWIDDQSGTIQSVDMDRAAVVNMRTALVQAGICSQSQADALSALADHLIPWTESVGLPEIGVGLVINARRSING